MIEMEKRLFKIIDGDEFIAFESSSEDIAEFPTDTVVEFIENDEDIFKFKYEDKIYWQYWYSAEDKIEEVAK
jgi:hypothetical protein